MQWTLFVEYRYAICYTSKSDDAIHAHPVHHDSLTRAISSSWRTIAAGRKLQSTRFWNDNIRICWVVWQHGDEDGNWMPWTYVFLLCHHHQMEKLGVVDSSRIRKIECPRGIKCGREWWMETICREKLIAKQSHRTENPIQWTYHFFKILF